MQLNLLQAFEPDFWFEDNFRPCFYQSLITSDQKHFTCNQPVFPMCVCVSLLNQVVRRAMVHKSFFFRSSKNWKNKRFMKQGRKLPSKWKPGSNVCNRLNSIKSHPGSGDGAELVCSYVIEKSVHQLHGSKFYA